MHWPLPVRLCHVLCVNARWKVVCVAIALHWLLALQLYFNFRCFSNEGYLVKYISIITMSQK